MNLFTKCYNFFYVTYLKIFYKQRLVLKGSIRSNGFFTIEVARGARCVIHGDITLQDGVLLAVRKQGCLEIGGQCFFNRHTSVVCRDKVVIGDGCMFGEAVKIYDHDHKILEQSISKKEYSSLPISIADGCWIANNVNVLKGSSIPATSVIGAMSLVNGKLQSSGIYAGIPVRLRKKLDPN